MAHRPFRVEAVLPAPAPSYFLERDSAAFRSLLSKVLKLGQLEVRGTPWHEGASTFVRIVTKPEFGSWAPKGVAGQLQSSNLEFHDIIEYNPAHIASSPYKVFIRTESPFLKDKLDIQFTMTIEEVDENSCRQILEGHISVRMFGVGRIVEGIVKDSLQNTYKRLPEIVRRWQLFREEALQSGDGRQLLLGRPPVGCEVQWIRQEVLQILQEPLLCPTEQHEGNASPSSALQPVAGTSDASEDSPTSNLPAQQQQQPAAQPGAAAEPVAPLQQPAAKLVQAVSSRKRRQQQSAAAAEAAKAAGAAPSTRDAQAQEDEDLFADLPQREPSVALSVRSTTEYFDAQEGPEEEAAAASSPLARSQVATDKQQATPLTPGRPPLPPQPPSSGGAAAATPSPSLLGSVPALAASLLARGAHHRRTISTDSATSTDTPGEDGGTMRAPSSRRFWRRFNRNYAEWEDYWDEVGVEQEEVEGQPATEGVVSRALQSLEEVLKSSYYSTSILVALFMMRRGWLRVEPNANANRHDERNRSHTGHRHTHSLSHSSSAGGSSSLGDIRVAGNDGSSLPPAAVRAHSLSRVAQEVRSRMVSGSRAVAAAPKRAMVAAGSGLVAAGSSVRQASVTGAKAIFLRPKSGTDGGEDSIKEGAEGQALLLPVKAAAVVADLGATPHANRHRKTMSLDAGTAAAAQRVANEEARRQHPPSPGVFGKHALERRPSSMAAVAAMNSMQRAEHRVHAPSRLSCFSICRHPPAVKD